MPETLNQTVDLQALKEKARALRLDILEMTTKAGSGHPSSSFSSVEILTALYFGGILRYRPKEPDWPERDRFIMSKGHAAPLLYAVLAHAGYFDRELLWTLRQVNSPVEGHPVQGRLPGLETTSGSLGKGISVGLGHVLGGRLNGLNYHVYVLLGDGECEEGQIWEAAMAAAHFKADNLIAIVDYNKYQETGPISREMALEPFVQKWQAFGWYVEEVDGHDIGALIESLQSVSAPLTHPASRITHHPSRIKHGVRAPGQPSVIIAHTVKGKGVSFVEADYTFHGRALTPEQAEKAREEILCG
ncbi:MAG TPA: transketolase [Anaerolineae bacterium]|nr:transketolase [Anaerolineae bacterium]